MIYTTPNIDKKKFPCDWNEGDSLIGPMSITPPIDRYIRTLEYDEVVLKAKSLLKVPSQMNLKLMGGSDICLLSLFQHLALKGKSFRMPMNEYAQVDHFARICFSDFSKYSHDQLFNDIRQNEVVYFSNPGNPSGFFLNENDILKIINKNKDSLFVVDLAYIEFEYEFDFSLFINSHNIIFIRTFSKFFGGAGIRLGALLYSNNTELSDFFNLLNSKLIGSIHQEFVNQLYLLNIDQGKISKLVRSRLLNISDKIVSLFDIKNITIAGNFIRFDCDNLNSKTLLLEYFNSKNIQVRELNHFNDYIFSIRISYRDEAFDAICF
jgi:histidinol-phosphate/aromatic aminotransferase/cobyric acid decarboxylase-like protein